MSRVAQSMLKTIVFVAPRAIECNHRVIYSRPWGRQLGQCQALAAKWRDWGLGGQPNRPHPGVGPGIVPTPWSASHVGHFSFHCDSPVLMTPEHLAKGGLGSLSGLTPREAGGRQPLGLALKGSLEAQPQAPAPVLQEGRGPPLPQRPQSWLP